MGTTVAITVVAPTDAEGYRALEAGFAEVAHMDAVFSNYRQDSDLARVNRQAGKGPATVPEVFVDLTRRSLDMVRISGGAFNPLVEPAVKLWGIPQTPRVPTEAQLAVLRHLTDPANVRVTADSVELVHPGMSIGFGAIAKGYTADRVTALLRARGIRAGIVAVAGDVRAFGHRPDGAPWHIGVRPPRGDGPDAQPLDTLEMTDGAVSTSGDYERFFEIDGVRYHHILDPRTLWPSKGVRSVTVRAPDGATADGLATALFVIGPDAGVPLAESLPGVSALFVDQAGRVIASRGWPGRRVTDSEFLSGS